MMNPGTFSRRAKSALSILFGCALLATLSGAAHAQDKKTVVVLEIQGGNKQLQQALLNALKDKYIILPLAKWNASAKKLNVTGQAPEDVALIAADVKADAVITGKIKQDKDSGQWKANIAARNGQTGKPLGKMTYDLKSQKVDSATVAQVEQDVGPAVEKAIKGEAPEPVVAVQTEPESPPGPSTLGKEEDPIAKMRKMEEEQRRLENSHPRPVWYPFVDADVGAIFSGRSFSFAEQALPSNTGCYQFSAQRYDPTSTSPTPPLVNSYGGRLASCPKYAPSVAAGVHVDVTAYPLAFIRYNWLRGLGVGGSFDYVFWPSSATGGANSQNLATNELRFEVGLRYNYNIQNRRFGPAVQVSIQYGGHSFSIAKESYMQMYNDVNDNPQTTAALNDHGLPDIFYQYLTFGVGGRMPYFANEKLYFGVGLNFNFHLVLGYGEIAQSFNPTAPAQTPSTAPNCINADGSTSNALYCSSGYGPVSGGYGLRAGLTLLDFMWKPPVKSGQYIGQLTARLQGYFELFDYSFALGNTLPPGNLSVNNSARDIAQSASDMYFGGIATVGWTY
jgi:hypothetical protein